MSPQLHELARLCAVSGPAGLSLAHAVFNLLWVPRLRPRPGSPGLRVSALVPARNEEGTIVACVEALLAEPVHEVLVYDDESGDGTSARVRELARRDPRVRLLPARPLPAGWAGKAHACSWLAAGARGEALLFVDADVRVERGAVAAVAFAARAARADVVTCVPRQTTFTFAERLVVPLLSLVYYALAPLALIPRTRDPRICAANGQLLFVTREALVRFGGHAAPGVRSAVVEDQEFCRAAKAAGERVLFADGFLAARCRMYRSAAEVRAGFVKNLYLGLGGRPARLALALAAVLWIFLLPWVAALGPPPLRAAGLWGVGALLVLRALLAARFRQAPVEAVALHPLAMVAFAAIALESAARAHASALWWRGRRYGIGGVRP